MEVAVDRLGADGAEEQAMSVRRQSGRGLCGDAAGRTCAVLANDRLAELRSKRFRHEPPKNVGGEVGARGTDTNGPVR